VVVVAAVEAPVVVVEAPVGSAMFQCPRCRARACEYTQLQTRSADEAMTNFCRCLRCGARWKE
jgi:transcription elongation factor S-II